MRQRIAACVGFGRDPRPKRYGGFRMIEAPSEIVVRFGHLTQGTEGSQGMEAIMMDKVQLLSAGLLGAGLAALSLGALGAGALVAQPAFAADVAQPAPITYPPAPNLEPRLAPDPRRDQIADGAQSTGSSSSSASASSSASSSVTVTGGKTGKCSAEASAHAKANDVEDSDHDLKVAEGDGCSAKAESSATVKPQNPQSQ